MEKDLCTKKTSALDALESFCLIEPCVFCGQIAHDNRRPKFRPQDVEAESCEDSYSSCSSSSESSSGHCLFFIQQAADAD